MVAKPKRGFPAKYVTAKYKVWPAQDLFVRQYAEDNKIAINEAARIIFSHVMTCPLFNQPSTDTSLVSKPTA